MVDLKKGPFYLSEEKIEWVERTRDSMTIYQKAGQLFCVNFKEATKEEVDFIYSILEPGAGMYRILSVDKAVWLSNELQKRNRIPMMIAANLEKGGCGIVEEGTLIGSPMEIAATGDAGMAEKYAVVCAEEAKAVGANWAFSPIIDIDSNYHNPITNTRTFGSDPQRVKEMGTTYVKAIQARGMAACIKHFPGDGRDERDQHLVTSVNDLSCEEWDKTYGEVYRSCIQADVLTCMCGHIMQPAWSQKLNPRLQDKDILPASLSRELLEGLLRDHLSFNGLICTDATTMGGYTLAMSRRIAVPMSIAAGADMFLFARNLEEDFQYMLHGIQEGIITEERLNEAVTRILAVKAVLGLDKEGEMIHKEKAVSVVGCERFKQWSKECADKGITLVKEEKSVLPLSNEKYKKVLFYPIESSAGGFSNYKTKAGVCEKIRIMLEKEGFQTEIFSPTTASEGKVNSYEEVVKKYDLIIYVANLATKSNQTVVRIEWEQPMGANNLHYLNDIPTIFISVENPYHLLDVPRVKTYINTYSSHDEVLEELVEKLFGRSEFKGVSPIDPFCGKWDAHL